MEEVMSVQQPRGFNYKILFFSLVGILIIAGIVFGILFIISDYNEGNTSGENNSNFSDQIQYDNLPNVPWSYYSMHVEGITSYDECFDDIIAMADEYNTSMTLLLWPQIRDHIQNNPVELAKMQGWIANGHEIGIHAQYCCAPGQKDTYECLSEGDGELYNQLVAPNTIKTIHTAPIMIIEEGDLVLGHTGCIDRLPDSAIYSGVGRYDGRTSLVLKYELEGKEFYELHAKAGYAEDLAIKKGQYTSLNSNEIYNFNSHAECDMTQMEKWLQFLSKKDPLGLKRKTQSGLMEEVILPNNQYIELDDVLTPKSPQSLKCSVLVGEKVFADVEWYSATDMYNFGRCMLTNTYCYTDETCPTDGGRTSGGYTSNPLYVPTKCTVKNIADLTDYKPVSELCQTPSIDENSQNCGDGTCSEKELERGNCPQDCDTPSSNGSETCGNGACEEKELDKGSCPQDCE
jgi:hypothetical protein